MHPQTEVTMVTSRQSAGEFVFNVHPNLRGLTQLKFVPQDLGELQKNCDLIFTATPHGGSVNLVPKLLEAGLKVIDMSADFRLKNPADYETYYGWKHAHPDILKEAAYGLPELHREEIKKAKLVACPGCMATTAILGLAPIIKAGLVDEDKIVVDLKVGSSGGGSKPTLSSHHPERFGGVRPYQVAGHRHIAEVEQELNALSSEPVKISFTPHAVNMVRGILATIHAFPKQKLENKDVWRALRGMYGTEPFVRLVKYQKGPYQLPDPKIALGTNFCDVGFEIDEHANRLLLFSALDNMCKGASGQGVQCMNLIMGIDETIGLTSTGFHPM
jgi:N-acetyl-gamma-glutamyl-phosphate/LysW-gamma-L-alpha-aminoadipyl-6-phosphate reductase